MEKNLFRPVEVTVSKAQALTRESKNEHSFKCKAGADKRTVCIESYVCL